MFRRPSDTLLYAGLATFVVVVSVVTALGVVQLESNLPPDFFDLSRLNIAGPNPDIPPLASIAPIPQRNTLRIVNHSNYPNRWEYLVETYRVQEVLGIAGLRPDRLDEFGSQGWEAVSAETRGNDRVVVIFKRPAR